MVWKKILLEGDAAELSDTVPDDVAKQSASAGVATQASRQDHLHDLDLSASGIDELGLPTAPLNMNSQRVTSVGAVTTQGDAIPADVNLRAADSTLFDGDDKATVQNHTPATHAPSHKSAGGDPINLDEFGLPTGAVAFNSQEITGVGLEKVGALPAGFDAQFVFLTTDDHPYVFIA